LLFLSGWTKPQLPAQRDHIRHYTWSGDAFVRTQPIVTRALDLPDEWERIPWSEAKRWTKARGIVSLQQWHARLHGSERKDSYFDFAYKTIQETHEHTIVQAVCRSCKKFPRKLLFDVVPDGPGYALASIAESR
jgi:hypothetical protein